MENKERNYVKIKRNIFYTDAHMHREGEKERERICMLLRIEFDWKWRHNNTQDSHRSHTHNNVSLFLFRSLTVQRKPCIHTTCYTPNNIKWEEKSQMPACLPVYVCMSVCSTSKNWEKRKTKWESGSHNIFLIHNDGQSIQ